MRSAVWGGADFPVTQAFAVNGHCGIDIGCPSGTVIYAARAGVVERVQQGITSIRVGNQRDFYLHGTSLVAVGAAVAAGTPVIKSDTVQVDARYPLTGPHLHFEIQDGFTLPGAPPNASGRPLDPVPVLNAASAAPTTTGPVQEDDMLYVGPLHPKTATLRVYTPGAIYRERSVSAPVMSAVGINAQVAVDGYCYATPGVASPDLSGAAGNQPGIDYVWWHTTSKGWIPDAIVDTSKLAGAPGAPLPVAEPLDSLYARRDELVLPSSDLVTKAQLDTALAGLPKPATSGTIEGPLTVKLA